MADNPDNKIYSAADIARYHKGEMTPEEMHAFEKAALEDPFLADAIEGYAAIPDAHQQIPNLHQSLAEKTKRKSAGFSWMKIAAALIITVGAGFLIYQVEQQQPKEIALEKTNQESLTQDSSKDVSANDQFSAPLSDSNSQDVVRQKNMSTGSDLRKYKLDSFNLSFSASEASSLSAGDSGAIVSAPSLNAQLNNSKDLPDTVSLNYRDSRYGNSISAANRAAEKDEAKVNDRFIAAEKKEKAERLQNQLNIFRGRVLDRNNNPLPFANITNQADGVGTYSDAKGNFNFASPDSVLTVNVRSIGFENLQQRISSAPKLQNIILDEDMRSVRIDTFSHRPPNALARADNKIRQVIEEPEPADGWMNYDTYILNNRTIPDNYKPNVAQTREVEVSFEVNKNGVPVDIRIEKSLCSACDAEAIRLVRAGPKWKKKGKKRVTVRIPF